MNADARLTETVDLPTPPFAEDTAIIYFIFDVNYETIIQSRGAHGWYHGVGMEGMKAFKDPSELLNQSIWQEARTSRMNFKTNSLFDYNPDGEKDLSTDDKR